MLIIQQLAPLADSEVTSLRA